jgi:hypothetical protein
MSRTQFSNHEINRSFLIVRYRTSKTAMANKKSPCSTRLRALRFVGLILSVLTFAPAFAHLAEMPNKMVLDGPGWYAAQLLYRGWGAFLGPIEAATLIVTVWLLWRARGRQPVFTLTTVAVACYIGMQLCFGCSTPP